MNPGSVTIRSGQLAGADLDLETRYSRAFLRRLHEQGRDIEKTSGSNRALPMDIRTGPQFEGGPVILPAPG